MCSSTFLLRCCSVIVPITEALCKPAPRRLFQINLKQSAGIFLFVSANQFAGVTAVLSLRGSLNENCVPLPSSEWTATLALWALRIFLAT